MFDLSLQSCKMSVHLSVKGVYPSSLYYIMKCSKASLTLFYPYKEIALSLFTRVDEIDFHYYNQ